MPAMAAEGPNGRPRIAHGRRETPSTPRAQTAPRTGVGRAGNRAPARIAPVHRRRQRPGLERGAGRVAVAESSLTRLDRAKPLLFIGRCFVLVQNGRDRFLRERRAHASVGPRFGTEGRSPAGSRPFGPACASTAQPERIGAPPRRVSAQAQGFARRFIDQARPRWRLHESPRPSSISDALRRSLLRRGARGLRNAREYLQIRGTAG